MDGVSDGHDDSGASRRRHSRRKPPKDPDAHYAGTCSIGFNVDNLDLAYEQLQAKGV